MPIIEQIADRAWPPWQGHIEKSFNWEYDGLIKIAHKVLVLLQRREELEHNLGEIEPVLSAATMRRDVWDASKSLWRNGHFSEAVTAASRSVNAALQGKVGRKDISEAKLVAECFSLESPKPNAPRLR